MTNETDTVAKAVAAGNAAKAQTTARGGFRPGSGRKKGGFNKRSKESIALAKSLGLDPIAFLLAVMADENQPMKDRIDCAKAVAPYVAPRLAAVESRVTVTKTHEELLDELDDDED